MSEQKVRCRFAPAPSGFLHVGGARTALFNWLFARHHGGAFILRVEDTDADRVTDEAVDILKRSLRWLGLDWDEGPDVGGDYGPYRQTERYDAYREVADGLRRDGHAYPCYCTPEELEERRNHALARGEPPGYDGRCRNLTAREQEAFEAEGRKPALRFAIPEGRDVTVDDIIRGETHFAARDLRDFIVLRSDGTPTYLLASGVDDLRMEMTHVIRGEDLLSSTPRQMLLFDALGAEPPRYAHLPLLLGPDGQKLSKRHGAVAVEWFHEQGFLRDAVVNYLALLGWSFDEHTELFTREQLVEHFSLERVSHNPARFDVQKLEWMNGHYIREVADDELAAHVLEVLLAAGIGAEVETVRRAVPLIKERMKTLREAVELLRFLFQDVAPGERAAKLIEKAGAEYLREAASRIEAIEDWTTAEIERVLTALQEDSNLSRRDAWQPIRAAITGSNISPPLFESIELLGKERAIERLHRAAGP